MTPDDGNVTPGVTMVEKAVTYFDTAEGDYLTQRGYYDADIARQTLAAALDPDDTALVEGLARELSDANAAGAVNTTSLARVALTYLRQQAQT